MSRTARNFCIRFDFNELSDDVILEEIENKTKGSNGKMVESIQEQVANDNNENDDGDNDDNDEEESDFEIVPNQNQTMMMNQWILMMMKCRLLLNPLHINKSRSCYS